MSAIFSLPFRAISWGAGQVTSRATNLTHAGTHAYKTAVLGAAAIVNSAADLLTLSSEWTLRNAAKNNASNVDYQLANTYISLLRVVNPNARYEGLERIEKKDAKGIDVETYPLAQGRITLSETPYKLRWLAFKQQALMNWCNKGNFFNRHVTARLAAPVSAIALIIVAAVRTVLGAIAAVASFLTLGCSRTLNLWAWHGLNTPGFMLNQLHQGVLGIVRPHLV